MSTPKREIKVTITGDKDSLSRTLKGADGDLNKFGDSAARNSTKVKNSLGGIDASMKGLLKGAALLGGISFLRDSVAEAEEAAKVSRLTEAAIKSTGGAANVTAEQISGLAETMSRKAAVDDEVVQSATNVLLTFTRVRNEVGEGNDVFNQGAEAALNISAALGTDLQSAVTMVGKALNDPIKGVTSLTRAGVQFTVQQKDQIKTLTEAGQVLEAQKIILAELETQFAGAAEAAATPLARLSVATGNLKEQLGEGMLPLVNGLANGLERIPPKATSTALTFGLIAASTVGVVAGVGKVKSAALTGAAGVADLGAKVKHTADLMKFGRATGMSYGAALSEAVLPASRMGQATVGVGIALGIIGVASAQAQKNISAVTSDVMLFADTAEEALANVERNYERTQEASGNFFGPRSEVQAKQLADALKNVAAVSPEAALEMLKLAEAEGKVYQAADGAWKAHSLGRDELVLSAAAHEAYTQDVQRGAEATEENTEAVQSHAAAMADAREKAEKLLTALNELVGNNLDAKAAAIAYEQSIDDLRKTLNKGSNTLDINTKKGRENQTAILNAAKAAHAEVEARGKQGQSIAKLERVYDDHRRELRDTMDAAGLSEEQQKKLIKQYGLTPKQIRTKVELLGVANAESGINDIKDAVGGLGSTMQEVGGTIHANIRGTMSGHLIEANGGVVSYYANGGMSGAREDHVAQIAPAGAWRVWAEPETEGEAYIPLAASKRPRSLSILEEVASRFGKQVTDYAQGGVNGRLTAKLKAALNHAVEIPPVIAQAKQFAMSQDGKPYVWGGVGPGGYDCSGFMSAITNVLQGLSPYARRFATSSFASGSPAGFAPGWGTFTVGVVQGNPGHMAGTLAGLNVESRGSAGVVVGAGARGAGDGLFTERFHLAGLAKGGILNPHIRDRGGPLLPGYTYNGTGLPEAVVSPRGEIGAGVRVIGSMPNAARIDRIVDRAVASGDPAKISAAILKVEDLVAAWAAVADAEEAAIERGELVDARAAARAERNKAQRQLDKAEADGTRKEIAAAKQDLADAKEAFGDAKTAVEEFDRAARQSRREDKIAADQDRAQRAADKAERKAERARERAENKADWVFEHASAEEQIRMLDRRIAKEKAWSSEWVALVNQRDQIQRQIEADAQRRQEESFDRLNQLLDQYADIERRRTEAQAEFQRRRLEMEREYTRAVADAAAQRREQLLGSLPLGELRAAGESVVLPMVELLTDLFTTDTAAAGAATSKVGALITSLNEQTEGLVEWREGLQALRGRGVAEDVIEQLGLGDTPQSRDLVRDLVNATDDELSALNDAVKFRIREANNTVAYEQTGMFGEMGRRLLDLQTDFAGQMEQLNVDHLNALAALDTELAAIGQTNGRTWTEAIAEGIRSGIPAIEAAVREAQKAMQDLNEAQAGGGSKPAGKTKDQIGAKPPKGLAPVKPGQLKGGGGDFIDDSVKHLVSKKYEVNLYGTTVTTSDVMSKLKLLEASHG